MASPLTLGFIGAGQMASAMIRGVVKAGLVKPGDIMASDVYQPSLDALAAEGIQVTFNNQDVVKHSKTVFLAVKPNMLPNVLSVIPSQSIDDHLIVSIAAGVPISSIESYCGANTKVVRVMPNTPCLVGMSAAAYSLGTHASEQDKALVESLLQAVGFACQVEESKLDAVTGLSGSGPAYVYLFIEALADGGVARGLPRPVALKLAAQTVKGAAQMVLETGKHPGELKDMVCSPAGTTIAAVTSLEESGFRASAIGAVKAATDRSLALKKGSEGAK
ncbi:unnamed protein product [Chrysoparadoxa australica]